MSNVLATLYLPLSEEELWVFRSDGRMVLFTGDDASFYVNNTYNTVDSEAFRVDEAKYVVILNCTSFYKVAYGKRFVSTIKRALKACKTDRVYRIAIESPITRKLMMRVRRDGNTIQVYNHSNELAVVLDTDLNIRSNTDYGCAEFISKLVRSIREAEGKKGEVKVTSKRDLLLKKYGNAFLEKENYLLEYYERIEYKNLSADNLYKLLTFVTEAHKMLSKVLNLKIYPKMKYIVLEKAVQRNWGYFYTDLGVQMRLLDEHPINILATYTHEYGHYIHHYLTRLSENKRHNIMQFDRMVREVYELNTTVRLIQTLDISLKFKRYLLKSDEIIARLFEHYGLKSYLNKGLIPTLDVLKEDKLKIIFTDQEIDIFKKYMSQMKL